MYAPQSKAAEDDCRYRYRDRKAGSLIGSDLRIIELLLQLPLPGIRASHPSIRKRFRPKPETHSRSGNRGGTSDEFFSRRAFASRIGGAAKALPSRLFGRWRRQQKTHLPVGPYVDSHRDCSAVGVISLSADTGDSMPNSNAARELR